MTVMVIIGLMTSAVILTRPKVKPPAQATAEQLVRDMNRAAQTSLISGRPMAFGLSDERYAILRYEAGAWVITIEGDFSRDIFTEFTREDRVVDLGETLTPLVIFEPTGRITDFDFAIRDLEVRYNLSPTPDGRVVMGNPT